MVDSNKRQEKIFQSFQTKILEICLISVDRRGSKLFYHKSLLAHSGHNDSSILAFNNQNEKNKQ